MSASSGLLAPVGAARRKAAPRLRRVLYAADLDAAQKFGSMEEQVFFLARAFQEHESLFLPLYLTMPRGRGLAPYIEADLPVAALDLRRFRPTILARLVRLVLTHRIEIIHWNFYSPLGNGYVWALTLALPWVKHFFTDHNSRPSFDRQPARPSASFLKRPLLKRYSQVMGVSQFVVDCLHEQRVWSKPNCCRHFINTDRFCPNKANRERVRERLGVGSRFVLLSVANLIAAKGVSVVLQALRELPDQVQLWVVGSGEEETSLRELSEELGVSARVRFLGLQSEVEPYMQASDCFVCPSLWAEAAGLVCIEAQACALPVIASDIGGIPEYVADNETGYLVPPGDTGQIAEYILRLLANPDLRQRLGQQARRRALEHFSAAARLDDFLALYRCRS